MEFIKFGISLVTTGVYIYCCWKIALRFGRSGAWGVLSVIPLGNLIYWMIISSTKIEEVDCGSDNV